MRKSAHSGFTLIEILLVVSLLSLLAALALPSFGTMIRNARTQSSSNLLTSHFALARMAAVKHNALVSVCPLAQEGICSTNSDWSRGWMVFLDPDGNRKPDALRQVLQVEHRRLSVQSILSNTTRPQLRYRPDGTSTGSNLTIWICEDHQLQMTLIVSSAGRVRTERPVGKTPCPRA